MAYQRVHTWIRIGLAVLTTGLLGIFGFVGISSAYVEGSSELLIKLTGISTLICFLISVVAWNLAFRMQRGLLWPSLVAGVSSVSCYYIYALLGWAGVGLKKATFVNRIILDVALFGTIALVFFMLMIASSVALAFEIWEINRGNKEK